MKINHRLTTLRACKRAARGRRAASTRALSGAPVSGRDLLLGHPDFGEKILIVGSGSFAVEVAREMLNRPDAGYRIAGFVGNDPELLGKSLINPRVIGLTSELDEVVRREGIDCGS